MLVRLCNIAEIFPKDGKFSCFWAFVLHAGSQVHAKDQISRQNYYAWIIAGRELGRSCRALSQCSLSTSAIQAGGSGQGLRPEEGNSTNPRPRLMALPHRLSLPFFPVSFFRFLFFPLVVIPCKFCE